MRFCDNINKGQHRAHVTLVQCAKIASVLNYCSLALTTSKNTRNGYLLSILTSKSNNLLARKQVYTLLLAGLTFGYATITTHVNTLIYAASSPFTDLLQVACVAKDPWSRLHAPGCQKKA